MLYNNNVAILTIHEKVKSETGLMSRFFISARRILFDNFIIFPSQIRC